MNNNHKVLNEIIDKNGLPNLNYLSGFKTKIFVDKYVDISLGSDTYFNNIIVADELICIKKCFLFPNCIGVTYIQDNKMCKFYENNRTTLQVVVKRISYILTNNLSSLQQKSGNRISSSSSVSQSLINAATFKNLKLTSFSNATFALNAEQWWLHCAISQGCVASSFNDAFFDKNKLFNQINNCYHFDKNYQSTNEINWITYLDISGLNKNKLLFNF